MQLDEAREFVRANHRAVLATRTSGGIQQSPVLAAVDEAGRITISSRETAYKTRNLRRDPWAQLCVFTNKFFGPWIFVEGTVDVLSLPAAMEPLVNYFRSVTGEHDDWDTYRESMRQEKRVLLRLEPQRVGPDNHG